jgi:peptidoglycan/xylan/chitin deacetylase (PgdA/CDA1 family)
MRSIAAVLLLGLLAGCATRERTPEPVAAAGSSASIPAVPPARGEVLGRSGRFVVYVPQHGDTLAAIAARFLGDAGRDWTIADFNGIRQPVQGQPLVVPLQPINPPGVQGDRVQAVPILCYHRFGDAAGRMSVSPANFALQLDWLARNGYHVLRLPQLAGFLQGREPLPRRSVVITMDDGYESVLLQALPLLRRHGYPATLFVYTDFVGARDALSWNQLRELAASGLVDVQAHSKTHRNLVQRLPGEDEARYRQALDEEVREPRELLERRLGVTVRAYAYPFGDADTTVLQALQRERYQLAVTVHAGGNPFYAEPLKLRRTMVYGDDDLEAFKAKLQTERGMKQR